jgi:cyanophycinase
MHFLSRFALLCFFLLTTSAFGAAAPKGKLGYQAFIVGNAADAPPAADLSPGLVLMGGGTDVDAAFEWMCGQAGGGDFVVIRASGTDAYNPYIQELCPQMDSVETIIITSREGAAQQYVIDHIRNAEALWIAGGDQSNYTEFWKGTPVEDAIHFVANTKLAPIGGTSAGLAILGQFIYTGERGSVTSSQALANPYHRYVTLDRDFLTIANMGNIITDSHFVTRDRMGRTITFLARLMADGWATVGVRDIGIDERTAVLVLPDGSATMVGDGAAYFLQANSPCQICQLRVPLTIQNISVYKVPQGATFNLATWSGAGGTAYTLHVNNGALTSTNGSIY